MTARAWCSNPIYVRGLVDQGGPKPSQAAFEAAGELRPKPCGARRRCECAYCADLYGGDVRQLVLAIAGQPAAFLTLTAPGFGCPHHAATAKRTCTPERGRWCESCRTHHVCKQRHRKGDPIAGAPMCQGFRYGDAAQWNSHMRLLWSATAKEVRRRCGDVRLFRVGEAQLRGLMHVHVLVLAGDDPLPPAAQLLEAALSTSIPNPSAWPMPTLEAIGWGPKAHDAVDLRPPAAGADQDARDRAEKRYARVAGYLAKYVAKDSSDGAVFAGGDPRTPIGAHVLRLRDAVLWEQGRSGCRHKGAGSPQSCRYCQRQRAQLGFRGHVVTRSHKWPLSFGQLRRRRADEMEQRRLERGDPPMVWHRPLLIDNAGRRGPPGWDDWRFWLGARVGGRGAVPNGTTGLLLSFD